VPGVGIGEEAAGELSHSSSRRSHSGRPSGLVTGLRVGGGGARRRALPLARSVGVQRPRPADQSHGDLAPHVVPVHAEIPRVPATHFLSGESPATQGKITKSSSFKKGKLQNPHGHNMLIIYYSKLFKRQVNFITYVVKSKGLWVQKAKKALGRSKNALFRL